MSGDGHSAHEKGRGLEGVRLETSQRVSYPRAGRRYAEGLMAGTGDRERVRLMASGGRRCHSLGWGVPEGRFCSRCVKFKGLSGILVEGFRKLGPGASGAQERGLGCRERPGLGLGRGERDSFGAVTIIATHHLPQGDAKCVPGTAL